MTAPLRTTRTLLALWATVVAWQSACTAANDSMKRESDTARNTRIDESTTVSSRDEIWLVSVRHVESGTRDLSKLKTEIYRDGCWHQSDLSTLVQAHSDDPNSDTVIYVHGNRTDEYWAKQRGQTVFQNLFKSGPPRQTPVRFVIWAWNSDRNGRGRTDFSIKSKRASRLGATFSATVDAFGQTKQPLIIGYSLGCQIIAKAFTYNWIPGPPTQYRIALIAPVLNCQFSRECCQSTCRALSVSQSIVFVNHKDLAVRLAQQLCNRKSEGNSYTIAQWVQRSDQPFGSNQLINITPQSNCQHSVTKYTALKKVRHKILSLLDENRQPPTTSR